MLQKLSLVPVRLVAVAGLLLSWLVTTHHCALLLWLGEPQVVAECCGSSDEAAPDSKPPVEPGQVCCKSLKSPPAEKLAVPVAPEALPYDAELPVPPPVLALVRLAVESEPSRGPPRPSVLLERVLRSCQRSTAPPVVA